MKNITLLLPAILCTVFAYGQESTFRATIRDGKIGMPLKGATAEIQNIKIGAASDSTGLITISDIPAGKQIIVFRFLGYQTRRDTLNFPLSQESPFTIDLSEQEDEEHLEEVVINATRSTRTIYNIPTRIEVIAGEELEEKGNMKPGDIRMLLAESTGIQTQQTSPTSGNSSIRIQGLDGKYTQVIRDGFPLYSGFSGGLGLLQIAPLDLLQVEVIKGSSSTLYGGGAIAGLVNLVSKKPTDERQLNFLLNGTSALGLDVSGFYAQKFKRIGTTIYAAYNHGTPYDPADIGLSAIPKFDRFTLNPKVYLYLDENTTLMAGINATAEKRIGGNMEYIKGNPSAENSYFEKNKTGRYSSQLELDRKIGDNAKLVIKNSVSYYERSIGMPAYRFSGDQISTYTEANHAMNSQKADWVIGANLLTDQFTEDKVTGVASRNYNYTTVGAFVQNTWNTSSTVTVESGARADYHNKFGLFFLPRISALWKINEHFSTRLGAGLGYKAPTVFTEDAERIQFRGVLPLDVENSKAERSHGANYDISYRTGFFDNQLRFSINHMFFYTRINSPVILTRQADQIYGYVQPAGNFDTKGMETNIKLTYGDFKLFVGYTYADVNQHSDGITKTYPLVSKHRLNNVLMYEVEEKWKVGAEAYYFSSQQLNDGTTGKSYWTAGLMVERIWEKFSVFVNFENFTNTRQTKFGPIYSGGISSPVFQDIYAPVDGFVANVGIKLKL